MGTKKIVSIALCLLLLIEPLSLYAFASGHSSEPFVFLDDFEYSSFGKAIDFYGTDAWEAEYGNVNTSDDFGYRTSTPPAIANGKLYFKKGDAVRLNWQKLDGFSNFDSSKTYTVTFDATVTDTGNNTPLDNVANWNRELYFAPAGYYNQIEIRSGNVDNSTANCGIRAGNTWVGADTIVTDTVYSCSVVWTPANATITTTIKNGNTVVATGSRTHDDFKTLNRYTRSWVWRCEDGQITVDNITFSNGTDTYTQSFDVEPDSMIENGIWGLEDVRVANSLTPRLDGGKLKLSTQSGVKFNWTQLPGVSPYSATNIYTFEFDLKVTDKGNGNTWDGGIYSTRSLYVGFGGWYTLLSMPDKDGNIDVAYGNSKIAWVDEQHLNTDLHATFIWSGNSITGQITDKNGNVLISGSRQNSAFTDMTVEQAAMTNLVLRCEDGAVEIDNFQFKEEKPRLLESTALSSSQPAVYNAEIEYSGVGNISVKLGGKALFEITPTILTVCTKGISGHYGAGTYQLTATVNPIQQMVSVELTAPDGAIVRRAFYQLLEGNDISSISVSATSADNKLKRSYVSYTNVVPNQYALIESEPVYSGVDANIYNVVTSFDDAYTTRNFAWTADASFVGNSAMALKYRVKGAAEWTVIDAVKENEAYPVPDEDYFKCDISALTADTEYEYKIGIKGSTDEVNRWSITYSFKTAAENVSDFSFIAVGDTQGVTWNDYKFSRAAYDEAFKAVQEPAFIMHTGDVVELGGMKSLWNGYFKALGDYGTSTPLFATIGNHDTWIAKSSSYPYNDGNLYFDYHFNHPDNGGTVALDMSKLEEVSDPNITYLARNADETVYSYLNGLFNQGYSRNTLVVVKGLLSGSLSYAVLPAGLLVHNPVSAVKLPKSRAKPKIPSRKKERIPITLEQWHTLMQRFPREHPSHIALNLGYHLGLRLGEAFGLMWEDVDFKKGTVSIRRQVQYDQQAKAWELTAPKYESFRTISVDDVLLALLKDEYRRQQRAKEYFGERYQQICVDERGYLGSVGKSVHLVNTRENGTFIQPRALQHTSRVIHKELNMPLFDFHSLRHTHTTLLLEAGANPLDVQERIGHSHLAITWRYAHNTDAIREQTHKILSTIYK